MRLENKRPFGARKLGRAVEDFIDNPLESLGGVIDDAVDESKRIFHNQMVEVVNRDRNGDGVTTDREREDNWIEWHRRFRPR